MISKERQQAFAEEYAALCRKHQMSLTHEDSHGAFYLTENFLEENIRWAVGTTSQELTKVYEETVVIEQRLLEIPPVSLPQLVMPGEQR